MVFGNIAQESKRRGVKVPIDIGALAVLTTRQYDRNSAELRGGNKRYGDYNAFSVLNNSAANVAVDLDFTTNKRFIIPAGSMITIDQVMFQEFNVTNLSAVDAIAAGEVIITVIYERPLCREG